MKALLSIHRLIGLFLAFLFFASCEPKDSELRQWMLPNGKIKVLATTGMIADIVNQVGGSRVHVISLIKGDLDPHSYQLVKGDDEKLYRAQIVFANGLGLEHGPSLQHFLKTDKKTVLLGDIIQRNFPEKTLRIKGQMDPHIWMDISLWAKTIPYIVDALSREDPESAEYFAKKGKRLERKMLKAHEEVRALMQQIPSHKRYLVTSHDAFNYFARAYLANEGESDWQVRFQAPEGLSPESQLSVQDIQYMITHLEKYNIQVLFPESNLSQDSIKKIIDAGQELGLTVKMSDSFLYGDAMGPEGSDGDTYIKMIQHNAKIIEDGLTK